MIYLKQKPLKKVKEEKQEATEILQNLTDLEIQNMELTQSITDLEIQLLKGGENIGTL